MSNFVKFYNSSTLKSIPKIKIKKAIEKILSDENVLEAELNLIFVDDDKILELNKKYLNHNWVTDVITFPLNEENENLVAEIYISATTAERQAYDYNVKIQEELLRLAIHGVLHLTGYNDKTEDEKKMMSVKEDYYLEQFYNLKPKI